MLAQHVGRGQSGVKALAWQAVSKQHLMVFQQKMHIVHAMQARYPARYSYSSADPRPVPELRRSHIAPARGGLRPEPGALARCAGRRLGPTPRRRDATGSGANAGSVAVPAPTNCCARTRPPGRGSVVAGQNHVALHDPGRWGAGHRAVAMTVSAAKQMTDCAGARCRCVNAGFDHPERLSRASAGRRKTPQARPGRMRARRRLKRRCPSVRTLGRPSGGLTASSCWRVGIRNAGQAFGHCARARLPVYQRYLATTSDLV